MTDDVKIKVGIHGTNTSVKDLKKVKKETHNLGDATDKYNKKARRTAQIWGTFKTAAKSATVAFAGIGSTAVVATKKFAEFDKNFTSVVNLLNDKSFGNLPLEQGIEQLRKDIIDLSIKSGESLDVLNKSFFDYISATGDAVGATEAVAAATDLAAAGVTDASIAVDGITTVMNAYGKEVGNAKDISSLMFAAQVQGKTNIEQLATSMGKLVPLAAGLGFNFQSVLAATSTLTLSGISTSEAMTGLKATLSNIVKPTQEAAAEAAALGIDFSQAGLEADGFQGFLNKIISAADGNKESLVRLFGSVEAVNTVFALAKNEGAKFNQILGDLNDTQQVSVGYADAVAKANGTLSKRLDRVAANADAALVNLGKFLNTDFAPFGLKINILQNLSDLMERFNMAFQEDTSAQLTAYAKTRLALEENKKAQEEVILKLQEQSLWRDVVFNDEIVLERLKEEEQALIAKANTLEEQMIREQELKAENDELEKERKLANDEEDNARIATDNATKEAQLQTHVENEQSIEDKARALKEKAYNKELQTRLKVDDKHYATLIKKQQEEIALKNKLIVEDATQEAKRKLKEREQFLKDEIKHGTTIAKFNALQRSKEFQAASFAANSLSQLQMSGSKTMQKIGKAAARAKIIVNTAKAISEGYAQLGPYAGTAFAALMVAMGREQILNVGNANIGMSSADAQINTTPQIDNTQSATINDPFKARADALKKQELQLDRDELALDKAEMSGISEESLSAMRDKLDARENELRIAKRELRLEKDAEAYNMGNTQVSPDIYGSINALNQAAQQVSVSENAIGRYVQRGDEVIDTELEPQEVIVTLDTSDEFASNFDAQAQSNARANI